MVASQVGYLNILQDRVCALVILQAKAVRIIIMQFGLLWLKVYKFSLGGKSGLGKSSMWDLKSGTQDGPLGILLFMRSSNERSPVC
jgi:hypothetical protein